MFTRLPKVYRAAKKGKILFWQAEVSNNSWRAVSGFIDGKPKYGAWSVAEPTNVGKKNQRDGYNQALFLAKAKLDKLLKRGGYFLNVEEVGKVQFLCPMLAYALDKENLPNFPLYGQPKLNGVRCLITEQGMFTRNGEPIVSAPHIFSAVKHLFATHKHLVLDGELYNHDLGERLNKTMSLIRKKKPTKEELRESQELVEFHCYDYFYTGGPHTMPFGLRTKTLPKLIQELPYVRVVPTHLVNNMDVVDLLFEDYIQKGYEGLMLRDPKAVYVNDRTMALLKYKPRYSDDFKILDVYEGKGKRKGMVGALQVLVVARRYEGPGKGYTVRRETTAKVNVKWKDPEKRKIWNERGKLIGTIATVSYSYLTEYGKPFHPYVEVLWYSKKRAI